jgi:putative zinc finger/helix-turn-helix YgiT family protein
MDKCVKCPECGAIVEPESRSISETWNVMGDEINVEGRLNYCPSCGSLFLDEAYDRVQAVAYGTYREKHRLMTPAQIRKIREGYGFSQELFSRILGIGVASLRRYEGGALQTPAIDALLHSAETPDSLMSLFEKNQRELSDSEVESVRKKLEGLVRKSFDKGDCLRELLERSAETALNELNGFRQLSLNKVEGLVAYLLQLSESPVGITKMCKLMFYCDFDFFRKTTLSITGLSYAHYTYGPVPEGINDMYTLFNYLGETGVIEIAEEEYPDCECTRRNFTLADPSAASFLDDEERDCVKYVFSKLGRFSAIKLSQLAHDEEGYRATTVNEKISYLYAEKLKTV